MNLFGLNADQQTDPHMNVLFLRELRFRSDQYKPVEVNQEKVPQLLKDAVSYWEESLRDAQKSVLTVSVWVSDVFIVEVMVILCRRHLPGAVLVVLRIWE